MSDTGQAAINKSIEDTIRERVGSLAPILARATEDRGTASQPAPEQATAALKPAPSIQSQSFTQSPPTIADTVANLEHYADRMDTVLTRLARQRDVLSTLSDFLNGHTVG